MGYEDRDYYRDESTGGIPGFQFDKRSIVMTLIIVNVVIFFVDTFTNPIKGGDGSHWLSEFMGIKTTHLWYVWTYLTYGFAHASYDTETGVFHLIFNMITLFFFGPPLERRIGRSEFLRFYLISIIVSGLGWVLLRLFSTQATRLLSERRARRRLCLLGLSICTRAKRFECLEFSQCQLGSWASSCWL